MTHRFDRDRTFKFQVVTVAVVALAGFGIVKRLLWGSRSRKRDPNDYIPTDPPPLPPPVTSLDTNRPGRASRSRPRARVRGTVTKKR